MSACGLEIGTPSKAIASSGPRAQVYAMTRLTLLLLSLVLIAAASTTKAQTDRLETIEAIMAQSMARPKESIGPFVINGRDPGKAIFRETVAIIGAGDRLICSGVLVDDGAVLTAAHCVCAGRLDRSDTTASIVFGLKHVGSAVRARVQPKLTRFYGSPDFCSRFSVHAENAMLGQDLALVRFKPDPIRIPFQYAGYERDPFIDREAPIRSTAIPFRVAPARIASAALFLSDSVDRLHVVGFGISEVSPSKPGGIDNSAGRKLYAPVRIESKLCGDDTIRSTFRCAAGREMVLIDPRFDSCRGDSGGPVFSVQGPRYYLVGITSRGVLANNCGAGGIYSLVTPSVSAWLRANGVVLHAMPYSDQ